MTVEGILSAVPGCVHVAALSAGQLKRVFELEGRHEKSLALPVRNLGISLMAERDACFVVLKSPQFRSPGRPSVYMVEEGATADHGHVLSVEGRRYAIVGEEVVGSAKSYAEPVIALEDSFVIFPGRRSSPAVPCIFLLPPLPFPELEQESGALGISDVISTSPSLLSDAYLRETFSFPSSPELATLLVGFNISSLMKPR